MSSNKQSSRLFVVVVDDFIFLWTKNREVKSSLVAPYSGLYWKRICQYYRLTLPIARLQVKSKPDWSNIHSILRKRLVFWQLHNDREIIGLLLFLGLWSCRYWSQKDEVCCGVKLECYTIVTTNVCGNNPSGRKVCVKHWRLFKSILICTLLCLFAHIPAYAHMCAYVFVGGSRSIY